MKKWIPWVAGILLGILLSGGFAFAYHTLAPQSTPAITQPAADAPQAEQAAEQAAQPDKVQEAPPADGADAADTADEQAQPAQPDAQAPAVSAPAPASTPRQEATVYITKTGSKYHNS